ncbi:MAG: diaminopimelate epimerase [Bacteroidota bacterium]
MEFFKYQGTGNDFILIDDRDKKFNLGQSAIENLCHRRFGIGADGLILLQNAEGYDFKMVYFNADGTEGSMCGNGGRCIVRFAHDLGIVGEAAKFIATDGEHLASVCDEDIFLKMIDVPVVEQFSDHDFANTGSPHYIKYTHSLDEDDVYEIGQKIRYSDEWVAKGGTNVNFVQLNDSQTIAVRTYERGVEDETYSCGTGVTACALSANLKHGIESPIHIKTLGGELQVSFQKNASNSFSDIYLIGPALRVFQGDISC